MCRTLVLLVILLAVASAYASSLRQKIGQQQLFGECMTIGHQCQGIAHSICAEAPTRIKRNAADRALMFGRPTLNARDGFDYGAENNEADLLLKREIRGQTEYLPPVVQESKKVKIINTVKHIYKDIHTRSKININQKVVSKHVYIHDVKNIRRELTVNHVNHNHHTDIVKHVQPILNELYITRDQKIIQPLEQTIIRNTESESHKEIVHPVVVRNKYENIQLPTRIEKTRYLGEIDGGSYRNNGNNDEDGGRINKGEEWRNDEAGSVYAGERDGELEKRSAVAAALARFKRAADSGAAAVCVCAEGFVPNKSLDGCL